MACKHCSLCGVRIWVSPDGTERSKQNSKKVIHTHKKAYTLVEEEPESPYEYRYWHDVGHFPG